MAAGRLAAVLAGAILLAPAAAQAHDISANAGDFWAGALHVLSSPEHLLALIGLGLLLGQGGREVANEPFLFLLPPALLAGVFMADRLEVPGFALPFLIACLLIVGGLVAAALPLPRSLLLVLVLLVGLGHGYINGSAMLPATRPVLFGGGVTLTGFLLATYAMQLARWARPFWARIAVRVAGSWVAATGILVIGMPR
jgi:urease accessory protein